MARLPKARSLRERLGSLGFQSKLLVMMLIVSVGSALVAGIIGYTFGTTSLRDTEYQRLTQLRESRNREITAFYGGITDAATVLTHSGTTISAVKDFARAFADLQEPPPPPEAIEAVRNYYDTVLGPQLTEGTGVQADPELYQPTSNAQTYLQNAYTVPAEGDWAAALETLSAGDPSEWSKLHARYQPFFADFSTRFDFNDLLLIDPVGNVVYSAYKGVDLGANILDAPYNTTELADAYRKAMRATTVDEVIFTDFERYAPNHGEPTTWLVTPIGNAEGIQGALAIELSPYAIDDVMTGNRQWEQDGLGKTGETYLAGSDRLMRSVSRELLENPDQYYKNVVANGTSPQVAERQVEVGSSVLLQPVNTESVNAALGGQEGVLEAKSYLGSEALIAYERMDVPGLDWVLVAKSDRSEALAPVTSFARNIALSTAAIVLAVSLLALLFSRILTRPVKILAGAVRRVSAGDLGVTVPVKSRDEFGELAFAFNDMSASLKTKQLLIDDQRLENDQLLGALMPEPVARRYREGEENISTQHRDVSVIYVQFLGFDEFSRTLASEQSVSILNALVEAFDGAAERHGVERVRSMQDNGLLATCGLVVPRVDHASRAVAFAEELAEIVDLFNDQHSARLVMRAGIDSGPVTSGLVGERSTIYALWGEAVDLAHRVHEATNTPGVFVSDRVREAVTGIYPFSAAGTVANGSGNETVWQLDLGTRQP
ncbi:MAG: adenylate/guanylate cyclase domain-containing protein [Actinomycetia bacterium]|nr:adenylate/guanylate cyclase domain-containing protein [Actinomycetes bacterium]